MIISRSVNVAANGTISCFLWPSNIPLCVCVCLHHIFFIHSSVDGCLGWFHVLAIVNSAAMNTGVHVSFQIRIALVIYPGVEPQVSMVTLFLVFKGTFILFSIVAIPVYIPANSVGGFPSFHTLSSIYCLWVF